MTSSAVICLAPTRPLAKQMIADLKAAHYPDAGISVLCLDPEARPGTTPVAAQVSRATSAGEMVGGINGLALGLASLTIPGAGLVLATGPVYLALTGLGLGIAGAGGAVPAPGEEPRNAACGDIGGALAGSIAGGLIRLGITAAEALDLEDKVLSGEILVAVQSHEDAGARQAGVLLLQAGGHDLVALHQPKPYPAARSDAATMAETEDVDLGTATRA